jgi:hypothetical protein
MATTAAGAGRIRTARSWSPKKSASAAASTDETSEDGGRFVVGGHDGAVPDRGFGLTDFPRLVCLPFSVTSGAIFCRVNLCPFDIAT